MYLLYCSWKPMTGNAKGIIRIITAATTRHKSINKKNHLGTQMKCMFHEKKFVYFLLALLDCFLHAYGVIHSALIYLNTSCLCNTLYFLKCIRWELKQCSGVGYILHKILHRLTEPTAIFQSLVMFMK